MFVWIDGYRLASELAEVWEGRTNERLVNRYDGCSDCIIPTTTTTHTSSWDKFVMMLRKIVKQSSWDG